MARYGDWSKPLLLWGMDIGNFQLFKAVQQEISWLLTRQIQISPRHGGQGRTAALHHLLQLLTDLCWRRRTCNSCAALEEIRSRHSRVCGWNMMEHLLPLYGARTVYMQLLDAVGTPWKKLFPSRARSERSPLGLWVVFVISYQRHSKTLAA